MKKMRSLVAAVLSAALAVGCFCPTALAAESKTTGKQEVRTSISSKDYKLNGKGLTNVLFSGLKEVENGSLVDTVLHGSKSSSGSSKKSTASDSSAISKDDSNPNVSTKVVSVKGSSQGASVSKSSGLLTYLASGFRTESVKYTSMYYYDTTPEYEGVTLYLWTKKNSKSSSVEPGLQDLILGIPTETAARILDSFTAETKKSVADYSTESVGDAKEVCSDVAALPVVGPVYKSTGVVGKTALFTADLAANTVSNVALAALIGTVGSAAIVVMVPITVLAVPFLILEEGPEEYQIYKSQLSELNKIIG